MDPAFLWIGASMLVLIGVIGTILPGLPGVIAVFGGMLLAASIDDFSRIGTATLVLLGVLTALAFVADIVGSLLGARRVGASRQALVGALIGAFAGLPFGLLGLISGPFIGAVIGEFLYQQRLHVAARVGFGTWVGLAVGTLAKIALVFTMLGVFTVSYFT